MPRATRIETDRSSSQQTAGTETSGTIWGVEEYNELIFLVAVSAMSGTLPTLDIKVQTSDTNDSSATWYDISPTAPLQIMSTGNHALRVTNFGKYVRTSRTVSGVSSPTATYTIQMIGKT